MRNICGLALILMTVALSGCVNSTFDNLTSLQNGCNVSATSVACTSPTGIVTTPTTPTTPTSPSGTPIVNTGNTTNITTGDTTIALESSVNTTLYGAAPAISNLITSPLTISPTANQQIWFNTNTSTNGLWPVSKTMTYNDYDTCVNNGGANSTIVNGVIVPTGNCAGGSGGTGLGGNYKAYRYYQPGTYDEELQIWAWHNSYATQYRDVTASATAPQHQAWSFGGNYVTAANMPVGGIVGYTGQWTGTATTTNFNVNTGSTSVIDLSGAGGTKNISQTVAPSNTWSVNGTSSLTADFGAGTLYGTLHSTNWQGVDNAKNLTDVNPVTALAYANTCIVNGNTTCSTATAADQDKLQNWYNWSGSTMTSQYWAQSFMSTDVALSGNITKTPPAVAPAIPPATTTDKENQVVGTAIMDPNNGWITDTTSNPMYAGFFGPVVVSGANPGGKPQEVTGTFALRATSTAPNGGNAGINNDRRGTIEMSGIFNGQ